MIRPGRRVAIVTPQGTPGAFDYQRGIVEDVRDDKAKIRFDALIVDSLDPERRIIHRYWIELSRLVPI